MVKRLRIIGTITLELAFYWILVFELFDVIANRKVRPPGYPAETWFTVHNYPASFLWYASLSVGAAVLFIGLPVALIVYLVRNARTRHAAELGSTTS